MIIGKLEKLTVSGGNGAALSNLLISKLSHLLIIKELKIPTLSVIERGMENITIEREHLLNDILYVLTDSVNNNIDEAIRFLDMEDSFLRRQVLTATYIEKGDYDLAERELSLMKATTVQESDWIDYSSFIIELSRKGRSFYSIDSTERAFLRDIAGRCPAGLATANAQSVLMYYFGEYFPKCKPVAGKANKAIDEAIFKQPVSMAYIGNNYPDPFSSETNIDYYVPEGNYGKIVINDMLGRKIEEYGIEEGENTLRINSSGWNQGVYYYGLIVNGKLVEYKKMVLTK